MIFDTNGIMTSAFTHAPGSSNVVVRNAGTYDVRFSVSSVEQSQFTLFVNGAPLAGSTYGSGSGTQQDTGMVIVALTAGDILSLVNHTSGTAVTLQSFAGGTQSNTNASLLIEKLG